MVPKMCCSAAANVLQIMNSLDMLLYMLGITPMKIAIDLVHHTALFYDLYYHLLYNGFCILQCCSMVMQHLNTLNMFFYIWQGHLQ